MKALCTGGAGFIGSHVAKHLLENGLDVVVLDDLSGGFRENIPSGCKFVEASILDYDLLNELFNKEKFDYVFHLAAYAAEGLSHFIRRYNYETNLIGSINLINLSVLHKIKCFVFTSSIAVYGTNQLPMTEELIPQPEDPYGISKYAIELDLQAAHKMFGLNYIIFRPHNVYGENQNIGDKYRNVIGIFINRLLKKLSLGVFGDGKQTRAFSYIDDVAPIIAQSINNPNAFQEVFNIGGETPYSIRELIDVIAKVMKVSPIIVYMHSRNEVKHAYSSHEKLRHFFTVLETTPLEVGITRMVEWASKTGSRKPQDFDPIEIPINLPTGWTK